MVIVGLHNSVRGVATRRTWSVSEATVMLTQVTLTLLPCLLAFQPITKNGRITRHEQVPNSYIRHPTRMSA